MDAGVDQLGIADVGIECSFWSPPQSCINCPGVPPVELNEMLTLVHFYLFLQVFKRRKPGIYSKAAHFYAQPTELVAKCTSHVVI